jgi:hypothetical protein
MVLSAPPRRQLCRISPLSGEEAGSSALRLNPENLPENVRRWKRAKVRARPKQVRWRWLCLAAAAVALPGLSLPARASLGGDVNSVESDRAQMHASIQVMQHDTYEVHEIKVSGGTVVDEYLSPEGKVFAVSWHGQFPPPMEQILGTYFQQYSAALNAQSNESQPGGAQPRMYGHRPLNIEEQGLVVQTGGHMRAHFGRVYVPELLPQGVTVSQIQ